MSSFTKQIRSTFNVITERINRVSSEGVTLSASVTTNGGMTVRDSTTAILAPIVNRIAMDVAAIPILHVEVDEFGSYVKTIRSSALHQRLTVDANIDQSSKALIQQVAETMLSVGVAAVVPSLTSSDPTLSSTYEIEALRCATVTSWYNRSVALDLYDEDVGLVRNIILPKDFVAIAPNPLYAVMNAPNSTLKRLQQKLVQLDSADVQALSPALDIILQLPHGIKNDDRNKIAKQQVKLLEEQLDNGKYGIGFVGALEKITQLNRKVENNLPERVATLTTLLYNQLGLTPSILDGTATQEEMVNYYNRTVLPVLGAIIDPMRTSFLSKNLRTRRQDIMAKPSLFKMAPIDVLASAADLLTRNEIMTGNEVRAELGLPKREEASADELRNKNLNQPEPDANTQEPVDSDPPKDGGE